MVFFRKVTLLIARFVYLRKQETESRYDRVLNELEQDRQEQARKWNEQIAEILCTQQQYQSTIGTLGWRKGLSSEASFRNALKGIVEISFGVQVLHVNNFDDAGEVFVRPDQVEIDVIISNGCLILCEVKSSLCKADLYSSDRKVSFYEKHQEGPACRKLVISSMVDQRTLPVAQALGIEVYSFAGDVTDLN